MAHAKALHDFAGSPDDQEQIPFAAGDVLTGVKDVGNGWSDGTHKATGRKGVFPTSFFLISYHF